MSKRCRGYPSETKVKKGLGIVHDDKLLEEKPDRNDLCPCGSMQLFQEMQYEKGEILTV
ncbi:MAG: SEC-C domain-containing protein [Phycisphaerae bacterium]|nr:SEC-C domain-containing protein [Phycisphaerae bacterium]